MIESMARRPTSVRIDDDDYQRLKRLVDELPMSIKVSDVIRAAVRIGIHRLEEHGLSALDELKRATAKGRGRR